MRAFRGAQANETEDRVDSIETGGSGRERTRGPAGQRRVRRPTGGRIAVALFAAVVSITLGLAGAPARADDTRDCFGPPNPRRVEACTAVIDDPGTGVRDRSSAHAQRALSHWLRGRRDKAMSDYDMAIELDPGNSTALNNRAWSHFRAGEAERGRPDVERSLHLNPTSPHALDTRAHILQWLGRPGEALRDYRNAMRLGGPRMVRLYQCGLAERGHYTGPLTGIESPELIAALRRCAAMPRCDPLPTDEECRAATS